MAGGCATRAAYCRTDSAYLCTTPLSTLPSQGPIPDTEEDEDEAASWLLLKSNPHNNGFLFADDYLDLLDYNSCADQNHHQQQHYYAPHAGGDCDSVVPVQPKEQLHQHQSFHLGMDMDYKSSKACSLSEGEN